MNTLSIKEYLRGGRGNRTIENEEEPHVAVVLLIDTSSLMPEWETNEGYEACIEALKNDLKARVKVEIMTITFDDMVRIVQPFGIIYRAECQKVKCGGMTSFHTACDIALDELRMRTKLYSIFNVPSYKSMMFIVTAGQPSDSENGVTERLLKAQEKEVIVCPIAIGDRANTDFLKSITKGMVLKADKEYIKSAFEWISTSISRVIRSPINEETPLSPPSKHQLKIIL